MKKKLLILAGTLVFFQLGFSMVNMDILTNKREELINADMSAEQAYQKLREARSIGYDFNDVYLGVLLKQSNSEELLEKLFAESATNVGKIVSLQGLYDINNEKYKKLKKKLRGKVTLFHGCYFVQENAKSYIKGWEENLVQYE